MPITTCCYADRQNSHLSTLPEREKKLWSDDFVRRLFSCTDMDKLSECFPPQTDQLIIHTIQHHPAHVKIHDCFVLLVEPKISNLLDQKSPANSLPKQYLIVRIAEIDYVTRLAANPTIPKKIGRPRDTDLIKQVECFLPKAIHTKFNAKEIQIIAIAKELNLRPPVASKPANTKNLDLKALKENSKRRSSNAISSYKETLIQLKLKLQPIEELTITDDDDHVVITNEIRTITDNNAKAGTGALCIAAETESDNSSDDEDNETGFVVLSSPDSSPILKSQPPTPAAAPPLPTLGLKA